MNKIKVLAVGPGAPEYLPPVIVEQAARCDLLFGGKRNLALFDFPGQEKIEITGSLDPTLKAIREKRASCLVGILVSGDAGIFSILPRLGEEFGRQALEVYPGISAAQYMLARLGLTWQEARFVSLHGREPKDLPALAAVSPTLVLFTDRLNGPQAVCRLLAGAGLKKKLVYIGEDLSYPTEKISEGRFEDFTEFSGSDLNLVVIVDE